MGLAIKIHDPLIFCADQIDVITNFAAITYAVIKRVHCTLLFNFRLTILTV